METKNWINKLHQGDARDLTKQLPNKSINCVITSPPYFGLRDYGEENQIGIEQTPEKYVQKLVTLFK